MVGKRVLVMGAGLVAAGTLAAWGQTGGPAVRSALPSDGPTAVASRPAGAMWVTRTDLEKIDLRSVADPPVGDGPMVFPDLQAAIQFAKPAFAVGEEVRAMLVVRSLMENLTRAVKARADLGAAGGTALVEGSARFQLARKKAEGGEEVLGELKAAAGGANRLTQKALVLKPGDFWVNMGDARNVARDARNLGPGEYVLRFWVDGQRAEGTFRITADPAPAEARKMAPAAAALNPAQGMVFAMSGGWQARRPTPAGAKEESWPMESPYPSPRNWNDFEPALGLGIGEGPRERYFARLSEVSATDDVVGITAQFVGRGSSHLKVTLTPQVKGRQIPRYPSLYLLVENLGEATRLRGFNDREYIQTGDSVGFSRPVVIDITLPEQGGPNTYFQGKARVSVVVASDPVWYGPSEDNEDNGGQVLGNGRPRAAAVAAARWTGMVKSAPMDVTLMKPGEGDDKGDEEGLGTMPAAPARRVGGPPANAPD